MATVRLSIGGNTFCGSVKRDSGTLARRLVHPTAPVLLTRNGPLGARYKRNLAVRPRNQAPIRSLGVVQGPGAPRAPTIISRRCYYRCDGASYSGEHFGGNQLLTGSIGLSPLCPCLTIDCTSEPLRASIRGYPDFTLHRHSSPVFGLHLAYWTAPLTKGKPMEVGGRGGAAAALSARER